MNEPAVEPMLWADHALAALKHLDALYYVGTPGGMTVVDYRAATDAIRTALDTIAAHLNDAARLRAENARLILDVVDAAREALADEPEMGYVPRKIARLRHQIAKLDAHLEASKPKP